MPEEYLPPGLMIAGSASGVGKTTVSLGIMRALSDKRLAVQPFKSGPDYIDPAFHRAASRRASYNLDSWAMDEALFTSVAGNALGADICIGEGGMGLFDGVAAKGRCGYATAAEVAALMGWPVVLVLDVSAQAQSAGAVALGFKNYTNNLEFAGVILNRVASPKHEALARQGLDRVGMPVLGVVPREKEIEMPERHLGLVQAEEHAGLEAAVSRCASLVRENVDLNALQNSAKVSRGIGDIIILPPPAQRIALAKDEAFSFTYPHLLESWVKAGADLIPFSPLADEAPDPSADLVWLPGGYPELHAGKLAAANRFLEGLRQHAQSKPVHGECGGYMVLGEALIDKDGVSHKMSGLLGLVTSFENRKLHLGYRLATLKQPMPGRDVGELLRGHEFHYSSIVKQPDEPLAEIRDANGDAVEDTGARKGQVTGAFFHLIAGEKR